MCNLGEAISYLEPSATNRAAGTFLELTLETIGP